MFKDLRRIVTGTNENGKSVVMIDGPPAAHIGAEGAGLFELWTSDGSAIDRQDNADRGAGPVILGPPDSGSRFRYFVMAPTPEGTSREELEAANAAAFAMIGAEDDRPDTSRHPGMHTTRTIDYIILLSGDVTLLLDEGEVRLKPFDTVVQRGTNHAWIANGDEPALLIAVLIDAEIAN